MAPVRAALIDHVTLTTSLA